MGRRSRKQREPGAGRPSREASPSAGAAPRAVAGTPSRPPWHPVPLVELCVLLGLVLIVIGCFSLGDRRGSILILCGLTLGSLAGLDTVLREHFSGLRSHTSLLAGVPTVIAAGTLYFLRAPWIALLVVVAAVFAGAFAVFRGAYRRRSGGFGLR